MFTIQDVSAVQLVGKVKAVLSEELAQLFAVKFQQLLQQKLTKFLLYI